MAALVKAGVIEIYLLSLLFLLLCPRQLTQSCPQDFNSTLGRCLLFNLTANVTWCDANRACAELGAELLTNWTVIQNLGNIIPRSFAWIGVSDLASERSKDIAGWQFVNGRGVMSTNLSVWLAGDPNNGGGAQDCVMKQFDANKNVTSGLIDKQCDSAVSIGYVCEIPDKSPTDSCRSTKITLGATFGGHIRWARANSSTPGEANDFKKYCFWEKYNVLSLRDCAMIAGFRPYSRSFLYNRNLTLCHVIEFSDSQTPYEQQPTSWVKYIKI